MHACTLVFLVLTGVYAVASVVLWDLAGWLAIIVAYAGASCFFLALAYAGIGTGLFGKRKSGEHSLQSWLLFTPYFLVNSLIARLHRNLSREPPFAEVVPNLFYGRRLGEVEARVSVAIGWVSVLDLAPEFAEASTLRALPGYRSFPILDATAPSEDELRDAIHWLSRAVTVGPVYVHCALGHGRTGCVVIAYLITTGVITSAMEGVRLLRSQRPGVRLNRTQLRALRGIRPVPMRKPDVPHDSGC